MLPRRAPQPHRRRTGLKWCSISAMLLLALCVAMPFVYLQYSTLAPLLLRSRAPDALTPLQRLQQQKSLAVQQQESSPTNSEQSLLHTQLSASSADGLLATAEQIAAAQDYLQNAVLYPKHRPTVPASHYVIQPEPFDMRQQHGKVKAFLRSSEFAAKQKARKANGEQGIIINAGGPHLISSTIVTLKVLREVLNCSLPVELAWHSPAEMDGVTLAALQAKWGPIRGVDLSSTPWLAHHRHLQAPAARGTAAGALQVSATERSSAADADAVTSDVSRATGSSASGQANHSVHGDGTAPSPTSPAGYQEEGLPAERAAAKYKGFMYKVLSLTTSSFASALLLDADNLPLKNPEDLWEDASFKLHGNLFWPDYWPPGTNADTQDVVYDMVGLKPEEAAALLSAGKGRGMAWRGAESGQVLFDLVRHGDIAEWALWINSFADTVYRALWGDKDTYALAFAVGGKAHEFNQLQVPPGGAFSWQAGSVLVKATQAKLDGWQLAGMVQYDAWGQAAFLHRTMNKFSFNGRPWNIGLLTGPLPKEWIQYYLSHDSLGPTVGVPVTYAAPASAFEVANMTPSVAATRGASEDIGTAEQGKCPMATFEAYWRLRQHAIPIGPVSSLDTACGAALTAMLGPLAQQYTSGKLHVHPELLAAALAGRGEAALYGHHPDTGQASPVLAWDTPLQQQHIAAGASLAGTTWQVAQASYAAFDWLLQHITEFPLLASASDSSVHKTPTTTTTTSSSSSTSQDGASPLGG